VSPGASGDPPDSGSGQPACSGGSLIRLRMAPGAGLAWFGPAAAAVAGALASGHLRPDGPSVLALLVVVLLVDPLLGGLWATVADTDWQGPWRSAGALRTKRIGGDPGVPVLPHTVPGSPAHRLAERLGTARALWGDQVGAELGAPLFQVIVSIPASLALAAVLGLPVFLVTAAALAVVALRALLTRWRRGDYPALAALYTFGLSWLVGYEALGGRDPWLSQAGMAVLLTAAAYVLAYWGYRILCGPGPAAIAWGLVLLDGGQVLAVAMLVVGNWPWQAGLLGLLVAVQGLWQPQCLRDGGGPFYLRRTVVLLLAGLMVAFA
jgi:hypothetical protein